jgi:hypothetical protein
MTHGICLMALGIAGLAIYGLPSLWHVVQMLFLDAIHCVYAAGPEAVKSSEHDPAVHVLVQRVMDLGFTPVGIRREWSFVRKPTKSIDLALPKGYAFATIFRLGPMPHLYFYTPMQDGGVVLTSDVGGAKTQLANFVRTGIKDATPGVLWGMHQEQVLMLCHQGSLPATVYNQETRLDATRAYYAHEGAKKLGRNIASRLLLRVAVPVCLIVLGTTRICLGKN